jgi:hypothetical protein
MTSIYTFFTSIFKIGKEEDERCIQNLKAAKLEGKRPLWRPTRRGEVKIKMCPK